MSFAFFISKGSFTCTHSDIPCSAWNSLFFTPCSFSCIPILLNTSTSTHHSHQRSRSHLACPLTLLGGPASCTSSWPSPLPGLPLSLGPQRQPAQSTHHGQGLANLWCAGSQGLRRHPAPLGWLLARWIASASGCGSGWSLESRGTQRNAFSGSSKCNFSEAKFSKVWGGDIGLFIAKCPAAVWYLAQSRYQHKTGPNRTGSLSSVSVYDKHRREREYHLSDQKILMPLGQIRLLKLKRTKSESTRGWGPL